MWILTIDDCYRQWHRRGNEYEHDRKMLVIFPEHDPTYFQCGVGGQVRVVIMYVPTRVAQHYSEMHASSEYGCMGLAIILNAGFPQGKKKLARVSEKRDILYSTADAAAGIQLRLAGKARQIKVVTSKVPGVERVHKK